MSLRESLQAALVMCSIGGCTQAPVARSEPDPTPVREQLAASRSDTQVLIREGKLYMHFQHPRIEPPEFPLATLGPDDRLQPEALERIAQWAAHRPDPERPITAHADRDIEDATIRALAEALGADPETFVVWVPHIPGCGTRAPSGGTSH